MTSMTSDDRPVRPNIATSIPEGAGNDMVLVRHDGAQADLNPFEDEADADDEGEGAPQGDGMDEVEVEIDAEVRQPNTIPSPLDPTAEEVAQHNLSHLPFRSWCPACVGAKAPAQPHRVSGVETGRDHLVAFDYFFLGGQSSAEDEEPHFKFLVVKDKQSRARFAHAVPMKGAVEHAVQCLRGDLLRLGYRRLAMKSDQEPALKALLKEVARKESIELIFEEAARGDPQSNGMIENGVRSVKEQILTMKLGLEARLNTIIPERHPILTWLASHAADCLTKFEVGKDGKTSYERLRGKKFKQPMVEFGEQIFFKLTEADLSRQQKERGSMGPKWQVGTWLGTRWSSYEHVVHTGRGIRFPRSIRRCPLTKRWDYHAIESISAVPWQMNEKEDEEDAEADENNEVGVEFEPPRAGAPGDEQGVPQPRQVRRRSFQIRQADLDVHGYTVGCRKCHWIRMRYAGHGPDHTVECRQRFENLLRDTARVRKAKERMAHGNHGHDSDSDSSSSSGSSRGSSTGSSTGSSSNQDTNHQSGDEGMSADDQAMVSSLHRLEERGIHIRNDTAELMHAIDSMGGDNKVFLHQVVQHAPIVFEAYSPERVNHMAKCMPSLGIQPGLSMDLTTVNPEGVHWDFSLAAHRNMAARMLLQQQPALLIGSPPCAPWSALQYLHDWHKTPEEIEARKGAARTHLAFCIKLYRLQLAGGRWFLHEHPQAATSWHEQMVDELLQIPGIGKVVGHQCQQGMLVEVDGTLRPIKKPTAWMSNSPAILRRLGRQCRGTGGWCSAYNMAHAVCVKSTAKAAAIYPLRLCRNILEGLREQLKEGGWIKDGAVGLHAAEEEDVRLEEYLGELAPLQTQQHQHDPTATEATRRPKVFDAITGYELDEELVGKARTTELEFVASKEIWELCPEQECWDNTGKPPISVRWVDTNKGDDVNVAIRSRLVAREIRKKGIEAIFAATPPLEALRTVISQAVTHSDPNNRPTGDLRQQLLFIDIKRAYFHAAVPDSQLIYVSFPPELQALPEYRGKVGRLRKFLYGTQGAAAGWEDEYAAGHLSMGFTRGEACPCIFSHREWEVNVTVHGDDFTAAGPKWGLDRYEAAMRSRYQLEVKARLGPDAEDDKEVTVLNRVVRWCEDCVEYEADPRQVEILIKQLELEDAKSMSTPGVKYSSKEIEDNEKLLDPIASSHFRAVAARANYLAQDRPDIQFSVKEVCREAAHPTQLGLMKLKRLGRYLVGKPRMILKYRYQKPCDIMAYADSDWAGCVRTRRSTSAGLIMLGDHFIKSWSSTQQLVALSSAEAEYYALVKVAGMAMGQKSIMVDMGRDIGIHVFTDSSAAKGIASRTGLGKLRHIEVHTLWLQEKVRAKILQLKKVNGKENPADAMTKHLPEAAMGKIIRMLGGHFSEGRAASAPRVSTNQWAIGGHGGSDEWLQEGLEDEDLGQNEDRTAAAAAPAADGGAEYEEVMAMGVTGAAREGREMANERARLIMVKRDRECRPISDDDILAILRLWGFRKNRSRQNVIPDGSQYVLSDTLGLVSDRRGATVAAMHTLAFPHFSKILNRYLRERIPASMSEFRFTTVTVNKDYAGKLHRDSNNAGPSVIKAFGKFTGGRLEYHENDDGRIALDMLPEGARRINIHDNMVLFNGRRAHRAEGFKGERYSVVWYACPRHDRAVSKVRASLRACGYQLPTVGERAPPGGSLRTAEEEDQGNTDHKGTKDFEIWSALSELHACIPECRTLAPRDVPVGQQFSCSSGHSHSRKGRAQSGAMGAQVLQGTNTHSLGHSAVGACGGFRPHADSVCVSTSMFQQFSLGTWFSVVGRATGFPVDREALGGFPLPLWLKRCSSRS